MMIRFTKFHAFVALLLTAAFVSSYLFVGSYMTAKACESNNCTHGCHLYEKYGKLLPSDDKDCIWVPQGVYWDAAVVHVGATIPGGTLAPGGPDVGFELWSDCCFRCLGNTPSTTFQETMDYDSTLLSTQTVKKNKCTSSTQ